MNQQAASVPVWDILVRVFHWSLASAFCVAYLSAEESQRLHTTAGYLIISLVLGRILWGFIGSPHARFSDFVRSPLAVFAYLKAMLNKQHPRYLGHNPAGGVMVLLLLLSLIATAISGMVNLALEEHSGPLLGWVQSMGWRDEHFAEELHEFFANFTVLLVCFHVGGVITESLLHKDNLVKAMFTGRKRESL